METLKKKNVNIRTVAEMAGVSIASVSRAFQVPPSPKISEKQRKRILDICSQLHYYPNEHTRRMFSRKSDTIALLFPPTNGDSRSNILGVDINFVRCMSSIQKVLADNGYNLLLNEVNEEFLTARSFLRMIRGNAVDGIIVWGALYDHQWVKELLTENIPVVLLQNRLEEDSGYPFVICDDYSGMAGVVEKAIAAGHRKFAFQCAPEGNSTGKNRNRAVRDTMKKYGIQDVIEYPGGSYGYDHGVKMVEFLGENLQNITCLIAANDISAWGCIDTLQKLGYRVPEDISVTGADGVAFPGSIRIDSFGLPSGEIGIKGAELLLKLIRNEKDAAPVILPVKAVDGNTIKKLV